MKKYYNIIIYLFLILSTLLISGCTKKELIENDSISASKLTNTFAPVLATNSGVTKSTVLYQSEDKSYNIQNLPEWAILDKSSGTLNVTPPSVGHWIYDVEVVDKNGTTFTYKDALRISSYPEVDAIDSYVDTLIPEEPISLAPAPTTVLHTNPQFFHNPDKNSWTACIPYYKGYRKSQQIMTVDLKSGAAKVNDTTSVPNGFWHMFKALPGPGSKTFIGAQGRDERGVLSGSFQHIHMYDTATHTFTYDVVPINENHRNATQRPIIAVGTNGKVYSYATMDATMAGLKSVIEFDPDTNTTRFWGDIPSGGDVQGIAADATHIYIIDDPYTMQTLRTINLTDGSIKVLSADKGYTLYQRKYGVVLKKGGDRWWLHNGQMILSPVNGLNTNPPWGFDDTDLYQESTHYLSVDELATRPTKIDQSALIPVGTTTTGVLWYVDPTGTPDTYVSVDFPNIIKHPIPINRVNGLPNGKIFGATDAYAGYTLYDPSSTTQEHYIPVDGRISNYGTCLNGSELYITGYIPGATIRYDSSKEWDNAMNSAYSPNNTELYSNPKNLGPLGTVGNIGKAYNCSVGSDGLLYIVGENIRSGTGGGMATFDPATEENLGIKQNYENSNVRNVVSVGDYMVTSSFSENKSTSIRIAVYDINQSKIVKMIYPTVAKGAIFNNAGRLVAHKDGLPYVYMYTTTDDNKNTRILKVDIISGEVMFDRTYPFESSVGGYNDAGASSLLMAEDGFLYAYMGKYATLLVRIDPETGDVEPFRALSESGSRFDIVGDDLYMGGSELRKISNIKVVYSN